MPDSKPLKYSSPQALSAAASKFFKNLAVSVSTQATGYDEKHRKSIKKSFTESLIESISNINNVYAIIYRCRKTVMRSDFSCKLPPCRP
jgi:endonuclease III-like uncharacterized protein